MHVDDCVRGMLELQRPESFEVFNLGVGEFCQVSDSVGWIMQAMGLDPVIARGDQDRGWIGDNPFTFLEVSKGG